MFKTGPYIYPGLAYFLFCCWPGLVFDYTEWRWIIAAGCAVGLLFVHLYLSIDELSYWEGLNIIAATMMCGCANITVLYAVPALFLLQLVAIGLTLYGLLRGRANAQHSWVQVVGSFCGGAPEEAIYQLRDESDWAGHLRDRNGVQEYLEAPAQANRRCVRCRRENVAEASYCWACGADLFRSVERGQSQESTGIIRATAVETPSNHISSPSYLVYKMLPAPPLILVGKTCPFCQTPIKPRILVKVCDQCGIPHHADCWDQNLGRCTTYGCQGNAKLTEDKTDFSQETVALRTGQTAFGAAETFIQSGYDYLLNDEYDAAIGDFDQAIAAEPSCSVAYSRRALAYFLHPHDIFSAAVSDFNRAIVLDPRNAEAHYYRGMLRQFTGDESAAEEDYRRAVELDPTVKHTARWVICRPQDVQRTGG